MEFLVQRELTVLSLASYFYSYAGTGMRVGEITGLRWNDIDLKSE